jgi:hypothetical protein
MTPLQRRRVHSGFYRIKHGDYGMALWTSSYEWNRERQLDYARKEKRRQLPARVLKSCVAVPCPPFQEMTLDVESIYNPITGRWDPISELPILDPREWS